MIERKYNMPTETKIYEKLLNNLNQPKDKFYPKDLKKSSKAKYYFKDIKDNCYDIPHDKLDNRARSIYSSASMIYNLLGKNVTLNNKYYEVLKCIRNGVCLCGRSSKEHLC
jgi:hypothetical protein